MALSSPSMDVGEELQCPICKEFLTDLVTLDCGHNFCRGCITHYCELWEELDNVLECPLCKARIKKGSFRPNFSLANIVDKIKSLSLNPGKEDLCVSHNEKLNLFCREDQELVCVGCERSPAHQSHTVLLLGVAAKECRGKLCSCLKVLRKEQERILTAKTGLEKESQDLLREIEAEKTKGKALFNQLHQFLEEQKMLFLLQMKELKKEIAVRREEHMARLMEELSSLEGLIQQMEEKCQQPASELLQDIGRILQRSEEKEVFHNPVAFPPELTCRIRDFYDVKPLMEGFKKQFPLLEGFRKQFPVLAANVTLDPDTAHCHLVLSEDGKSVRREDEWQDLPNNPERFDTWSFVLGCEGFTSGSHRWEVTVGGEGDWAVGVARKSVRRKGRFDFSPKEGIWAVGRWLCGGKYVAFTHPKDTPLIQAPKRVRVTLDCAEGQVAFSDAETGAHLHTFSGASCCGETLLPFFCVFGEAHLTLSP